MTPTLPDDLGDLDRIGLSPLSISVVVYCIVAIVSPEDTRQNLVSLLVEVEAFLP